jgi:hypothetical protein
VGRDRPAAAAPTSERARLARSAVSVIENLDLPRRQKVHISFRIMSAFEQNQSYQLIHGKQSVFTRKPVFRAPDQDTGRRR